MVNKANAAFVVCLVGGGAVCGTNTFGARADTMAALATDSRIQMCAHCAQEIQGNTKTYWPAGGGRGQNPENTAQGNSGQNAIRP